MNSDLVFYKTIDLSIGDTHYMRYPSIFPRVHVSQVWDISWGLRLWYGFLRIEVYCPSPLSFEEFLEWVSIILKVYAFSGFDIYVKSPSNWNNFYSQVFIFSRKRHKVFLTLTGYKFGKFTFNEYGDKQIPEGVGLIPDKGRGWGSEYFYIYKAIDWRVKSAY